jgi:streptogramin lyase
MSALLRVAIAVVAVALLSEAAAAQEGVHRAPFADVVSDTIVLPGASPGVTDAPQHLAVTSDAVWIVYHRAGRVDRIDPETNQVVASVDVPVPGCVPGGCLGLERIAADQRSVWVYNNQQQSLAHIDPRTNRVVGSIPTSGLISTAPVIDHTSVWAALSPSGDVMRINARTEEVTKRVHVRDAPAWPLAVVDGVLWVGSYDPGAPPERAGALHRIDPATGRVTKTVYGATGTEAHVVDGDLWITGCGYLRLPEIIGACPSAKRVDGRTGALEADLPLGGVAFTASRGGGDAFVSYVENGPGTPAWLSVIDASTNRAVASYDLPESDAPAGLAFGDGSLWVTDWSANTVARVRIPAARVTAPG